MKKSNTNNRKKFIEKARNIHGDKYDYSKVEYINCKEKVCIICPIHGEFYQTSKAHLQGNGCKQCGNICKTLKLVLSIDVFIEKGIKVHRDKYDYSKVQYNGNKEKVCIICKEHGEFWQRPNDHLNGHGCPKCSNNIKYSNEEWIEHARKIHGDRYDYSKVNYGNSKTKVCIICPIHGKFYQIPSEHLSGKGCSKCIGRDKTNAEYILESKLVHGDKYDYSKVEYISSITKVCIICPTHGIFYQTPHDHLHGKGCPICNESHLEKGICKLLTDNGIEYDRQKRFSWLGRQSLDFYIESLHLGIECQGKQHFEPIDFFGGKEGLRDTLNRDNRKLELCAEHGIKLLYYTNLTEYDTFLGNKLIKSKEEILKAINNF